MERSDTLTLGTLDHFRHLFNALSLKGDLLFLRWVLVELGENHSITIAMCFIQSNPVLIKQYLKPMKFKNVGVG